LNIQIGGIICQVDKPLIRGAVRETILFSHRNSATHIRNAGFINNDWANGNKRGPTIAGD
jgi:hypothetical protein